MLKTIIIHTENKNKLLSLLDFILENFNKTEYKLFLNSKNYIPWSDEKIKNEIVSHQEFFAFPTNKNTIESVIELVLKSKTEDIIICDEEYDTNKFFGTKSEFLSCNLDTKYNSLNWFLIDVLKQLENKGKQKFYYIPNDNSEDSIRFNKKIESNLFNEKIIHIDGGLGDHIMALPLLNKIQNDVYVCCKYPFVYQHLNLKGLVNWTDELFGGYSRFVYEYGSANNVKTIIDAFFGLYGVKRSNEDKLIYSGLRESDNTLNVSNKNIALICTSAAKIQNQDSNKDWKDIRWMKLVYELKSMGYYVIQVGTSKDNQIPIVDLKFLDKPISQLAWLIDNSTLWISVDTFFHHFASAIKPDVGICITPFYNDHAKHPGVKYIEKDCGKNYWERRWWMDLQQPERKECMDLIQVDDVLKEI
jgi:hypothetical protein